MNLYLRSLRPVQLRLVAAIARHGKLRLAAASCGMTVPAASRMLTDMETQLNAALFERTAKVDMRLTELLIDLQAGPERLHGAGEVAHLA